MAHVRVRKKVGGETGGPIQGKTGKFIFENKSSFVREYELGVKKGNPVLTINFEKKRPHKNMNDLNFALAENEN